MSKSTPFTYILQRLIGQLNNHLHNLGINIDIFPNIQFVYPSTLFKKLSHNKFNHYGRLTVMLEKNITRNLLSFCTKSNCVPLTFLSAFSFSPAGFLQIKYDVNYKYRSIINLTHATSFFWKNKKVLLRERKTHTARRVASARYAGRGDTPSSHGWGVPPTIQTWDGVPPPTIQTWDGVLPPPTIQTWDGVPPPTIQTWDGVLPHPPSRPGMGYPFPLPPPLKVEQTHTCENITSRRTYVRGR